MNRRAPFLCLISSILLAACAFGYQARGTMSDVVGEMRGKGFPGNAAGGGRFVLVDSGGGLQCDGEMAPPSGSLVSGSCEGERGKGVVRCSDGRVMAAEWRAISCRAFEGEAMDARGSRLTFRIERKR